MSRGLAQLEQSLKGPGLPEARVALESARALSESDRTRMLVRAFSSPHWEIRKLAARHLASQETGQVLASLEEVLADPVPGEDSLYWTIHVLGSMGESGARHLLEFFPRCPSQLRVFLLQALARCPTKDSVALLIEQLGSDDWALREEAARGLVACSQHSLPAVRQLLNTGTEDQRFWAFRILAQVMGPKAVEPLTKILKGPGNEQQATYVLAALKEIRHPSVVPVLVGLLEHESWYFRAEVAEALVMMGDLAVPELKRALQSESSDMRYWAMRILRDTLQADVVPILEPYLRSPERSTRYSTVMTIGGLLHPEAVRVLVQCFEDEAWVIRKLASTSLARMGDVAVKILLDNLQSGRGDESLFWTLTTLGELGAEAAVPFVAAVLDHESKNLRLQAVEALGRIGTRGAASELVMAFRNRYWIVRQRASEALREMGKVALPVLIESAGDDDDNVAYWTQTTLLSLPRAGVSDLASLLSEAGADERDRLVRRLRQQSDDFLWEFAGGGSIDKAAILALPAKSSEPLKDASGDIRRRGRGVHPTAVNLFSVANPTIYPMSFDDILLHAQKCCASDLHIKIGYPPVLRIHGVLNKTNFSIVTPEASRSLLASILTDSQKHALAENLQLDLSYEVTNGCRFRINIYKQTRGLEAACRYIDPEVPTFRQLGLPEWVMQKIGSLQDGLVLVTGPTGSGKSTTIASLIAFINRHFTRNIITIEDPIEFVHENILSFISYREVGVDVSSFSMGLRGALREDPDIILIGELRDSETISTALTLAGTGHLVLSTFHTSNAASTVEQIVDFYSTDQQLHIRRQLGFNLRAVVSQRLFLKGDGRGRVPALEILLSTTAVRNLIREGNLQQLTSVMQASRDDGMCTFDMSLADLVADRIISYEDALPFVADPQNFKPKGFGRHGKS